MYDRKVVRRRRAALAVFVVLSIAILTGYFGESGGGSLLQGMDQRLRDECQMPAQVTESPLTCVAVGSGRSLEEFEVIHRMSRNSHRRLVATG